MDERKVAPIAPFSAACAVHLRIDADVLAWLRAQGRGHLTRMNAVPRADMEAHKGKVR
jgi:uncharacterized protein (DUF4415 family)